MKPSTPRSQDKEAQCRNKMTFGSRGEARAWSRAQPRNMGRPYPCEFCGAFHLSTMNKRQARARGLSWR